MKSGLIRFGFLLIGVGMLLSPPLSMANNDGVPRGWWRIHIGHVSFYLPPHLKRTGLPGNRGVIAAFAGRHNEPYVSYAYGPQVPCAEADRSKANRTDVVINGKKAQLESVVVPRDEMLTNTKDRHTIILCVPDVGDGKNKFEIYVATLDVDLLNVMKRSFDHVRFR